MVYYYLTWSAGVAPAHVTATCFEAEAYEIRAEPRTALTELLRHSYNSGEVVLCLDTVPAQCGARLVEFPGFRRFLRQKPGLAREPFQPFPQNLFHAPLVCWRRMRSKAFADEVDLRVNDVIHRLRVLFSKNGVSLSVCLSLPNYRRADLFLCSVQYYQRYQCTTYIFYIQKFIDVKYFQPNPKVSSNMKL